MFVCAEGGIPKGPCWLEGDGAVVIGIGPVNDRFGKGNGIIGVFLVALADPNQGVGPCLLGGINFFECDVLA